ncbi:MAG TPA: hypothetical protein EYG86_00945 [Crocinitomicaceae bacterium]|nr:hypothetical protein [Crocinitomicaceae bacterium]
MRIYLLITLLLLLSNCFSQSIFEEQSVKNSEYIFEGEVIKVNYIQDTSKTWMSVFKIVVVKDLKKKLKLHKHDTVELVTKLSSHMTTLHSGKDGSFLEIIQCPPSHSLPRQQRKGFHLYKSAKGIFLANDCKKSVVLDSKHLVLSPICEDNNCYYLFYYNKTILSKNYEEIITSNIQGFNQVYENKDDFNKLLKKLKLHPLFGTENKRKCFLKKKK